MVRTNVCVPRGMALMALCIFCGCHATTMNSAQRVAAESPPAAAPLPQQSVPQAPEAIPMVDPYAGVPSKESAVQAPRCWSGTSAVPANSAMETIIYSAELRGRLDHQTGQRLTIEPLVVTSATLPVPGCKAKLSVEAKKVDGVSDWKDVGEVQVVTRVEFGMPVEVDIVDDDMAHRIARINRGPLAPGSKIRILWEWQ